MVQSLWTAIFILWYDLLSIFKVNAMFAAWKTNDIGLKFTLFWIPAPQTFLPVQSDRVWYLYDIPIGDFQCFASLIQIIKHNI